MNTGPRMSLAAVITRRFMTFGAALLVVLILGANAFAATPVDIYQEMENGNSGDLLTAAIMNGSNHGDGTWRATHGSMWVSTAHHRNLPGPVVVGGTTYNGTGGSRTWMFNDRDTNTYVSCVLSGSYATTTMACYYTPGITNVCYTFDDTFRLAGYPAWAVMQTHNHDGAGPWFFAHASLAGNGYSTRGIKWTRGHTYWINLHHDAFTGTCFVAAFDPDRGFAQLGPTITAPAVLGAPMNGAADFGRADNHGTDIHNNGHSYVGHICIDYSNGAFPLLPSGGGDTTAPGAPPVVRDGTGADQSIALSSTQLSANWDPASDAESGIKGYRYAIGTTPGGTDVVPWTPLANVLGVTKTGLSLTQGLTYYFSVKAVNGVGLVGSATTSKGQKVGTDTTPPSAPAAVRDGGMYRTLGTDCDATTSTTELACNFDPATDAESGIRGYEYAIGTTPGGTDTVNWTSGLASNAYLMYVRVQNLRLTPGRRYYFSIRAINNTGLTGPAKSSDGQVVVDKSDTTPPSAPPAVRDGTGAGTSTTMSTTQLSANWDMSTDPESGISGYQYAIGTTAGGTQIVHWTSLGYVSQVTRTGLSLTVGQTYYFSVRAKNGNGLTGGATNSKGQTVVRGGD